MADNTTFWLDLKLNVDSVNEVKKQIQDLYNDVASKPLEIKVEADKSLKKLQASAQKGVTSTGKSNVKSEIQDLTKLNNLYIKTIGLEQRRADAQRKWTAARNGLSSSNYEAISGDIAKESKLLISQMDSALKSRNASGLKDFSTRYNSLAKNFKENALEIKSAGEDTTTVFSRIGKLSEKFTTWFSITRVIMYVVQQVKQLAAASIELDTAMTQLQIVTRASDGALQSYGTNIASTAKEISASISDLIDSTTTYARLGYSLDESSELAKYTAMLKNVGDIDVGDAQNSITAIIKAFDIDASEIESVMNKLVVTGNNFPISVAEIAEGMNNASSALAAAGNTFEQSVALLTAANTTVQDASKSSTGLRTIAARIRNTSTELSELGEEPIETSKYAKLVEQLSHYKVALTDINGEYRSTYDIMQDLSKAWGDMTSLEQSAIATALAGKFECPNVQKCA